MKFYRLTSIVALVLVATLMIPSVGTILGSSNHQYVSAAQYQTNDSVRGYAPVGSGPVALLIYPPNGNVYVANRGSDTVTVLNPTNSLVATINVGPWPVSFAYDSGTNMIYLCDSNNGYSPWEIQEIDPTTNTVTGTLSLSGAACQDLAVDPAIGVVFVSTGNDIAMINDQTFALIGTFPFNDANYPNSDATALLYDAANGYLYIGDYSGGIGVVTAPSATPSSDLISFTISTNGVGVLHQMALDSVTGMMYVITGNSGNLIDTHTSTSYRFNTCSWYQSAGVAADPVNGLFYVSNPAWPGQVNACQETTPPGSNTYDTVQFDTQYGNPWGVAYNPVNNLVYVTLFSADQIAEIVPAVPLVTQHATTTSVACDPSPLTLDGQATCVATVTDSAVGPTTPTGQVSITASSGTLSASSCTLAQGSNPAGTATCSVTYIGTAVGSSTISASYGGDTNHFASSGSISLQVQYEFGGFLPPLVSNGNYKDGRTIPVKFQLTDASGNYVSTAVAKIYVDGNPGVSSGTSNIGNFFRYDFTSNQYIFNLSTEGLHVGVHTITVALDDGMTYTIVINLRG